MIIDTDYDAERQQVPLDDPAAVEWLARLAKNVPTDVAVGRPLLMMFDPGEYCMKILTTVGIFDAYHAHVERLLEIVRGDEVVYEHTSYCGGVETDRIARRMADLRPRPAVE